MGSKAHRTLTKPKALVTIVAKKAEIRRRRYNMIIFGAVPLDMLVHKLYM